MELVELRQILNLALTAPSGDNCQPWRLEWDGQKLVLFHLEARGQHALNRNNHASLIALGAFIKLLELAASALGYKVHEAIELEVDKPIARWAEFTFEKGEKRNSLVETIQLRHTDRRIYHGGDPTEPVFADVRLASTEYSKTKLYFSDAYSDELFAFIKGVEVFPWVEPTVHADLMKWIRFSRTEVEGTLDGMPWETLGVNAIQARLLEQCKSWKFQTLMNKTGFLWNLKNWTQKLVKSGVGLMMFTTTEPRPRSAIEVGKLGCVTWLRLNSAGYGVQPMTMASLSVFDAHTLPPSPKISAEFTRLFQGGRAVLQKTFGFPSNEMPVWMIRTGRSNPLPDRDRTKRLPLEKVLVVVK